MKIDISWNETEMRENKTYLVPVIHVALAVCASWWWA